MNVLIDVPKYLREIDTVEKHLDEIRIKKLKNFGDLFSDALKKYYKPLDIVVIYIDLILKADKVNNIEKGSELN